MAVNADASNRYTFKDTEENEDFYPMIYNCFHIKTTQFHILAITNFLKSFSYRRYTCSDMQNVLLLSWLQSYFFL